MDIHKNISTFFGVGHTPKAPGTAGAFAGVAVFVLLQLGFERLMIENHAGQAILCLLTILLVFVGVFSIKKMEEVWKHDASEIVIDEVAGVWVALLFVPFSWQYYLAGFILFRFFDIVKPLFIKKIDQLKSGWSVMLDDVVAGIYANVVLQIVIFYNG